MRCLLFSVFFFASYAFASEPSKIFERLHDRDVKGDLLDFLLFTDFSLQAEADMKRAEAELEVAKADLEQKKERHTMYENLVGTESVTIDVYEEVAMLHKRSLLQLDLATARLKELTSYANIWNMRAHWIKVGKPDDVEILRTSYLDLWKSRCQQRALELGIKDEEIHFARSAYFRAQRLTESDTVTREEFIRRTLAVRTYEEQQKAAIYLDRECQQSLRSVAGL